MNCSHIVRYMIYLELLRDNLFVIMERNGNYGMQNVIYVLNEEEYDTDAIEEDCNGDSNILKSINSKSKRFIIKDFLRTIELEKYTFSPGELMGCIDSKYLRPKYSTLKEEILKNEIHPLGSYQFSLILHKATKYIHSTKAKKLVTISNERVTTSQLLAVCLYCNCTDLCTAFSATFRKNKWNETRHSVKQRNQEFSHMASLLRQTKVKQLISDNGPFFCGIDRMMVLNEFKITLKSPTSTSKCRSVAETFGTKDGIVVQLNNQYNAPSFHTSWISDYPTENEYLFGQNYVHLQVQTVIIQGTINFAEIFSALTSLHLLLMNEKIEIKSEWVGIWVNLMEFRLGITANTKYKEYIHATFHAFTTRMRQIKLDLDHLNTIAIQDDDNWNRYLKLLFVWKDAETSSVISCRIFQLFPFIQCIRIYTSSVWNSYEFCLLSLLQELEGYSQFHIDMVKARCD